MNVGDIVIANKDIFDLLSGDLIIKINTVFTVDNIFYENGQCFIYTNKYRGYDILSKSVNNITGNSNIQQPQFTNVIKIDFKKKT